MVGCREETHSTRDQWHRIFQNEVILAKFTKIYACGFIVVVEEEKKNSRKIRISFTQSYSS